MRCSCWCSSIPRKNCRPRARAGCCTCACPPAAWRWARPSSQRSCRHCCTRPGSRATPRDRPYCSIRKHRTATSWAWPGKRPGRSPRHAPRTCAWWCWTPPGARAARCSTSTPACRPCPAWHCRATCPPRATAPCARPMRRASCPRWRQRPARCNGWRLPARLCSRCAMRSRGCWPCMPGTGPN